MELNIFPDINAFWCYYIILLLSAVTVKSKIESIAGVEQNKDAAWQIFDTWVFGALYIIIPLFTFWLLDRSNTIPDTSMMGALILSLGYIGWTGKPEQPSQNDGDATRENMQGGMDKLSFILQPLQIMSENLSTRVTSKMASRGDALRMKIVGYLLESQEDDKKKSDPSGPVDEKQDQDEISVHRLDHLKELVFNWSQNKEWVRKTLDGITEKHPEMGKAAHRNAVAQALYTQIRISRPYDFGKMLFEERIFGPWFYWITIRTLHIKILRFLVISALIITPFFLYYQTEKKSHRFYAWRLAKQNTTAPDNRRSIKHFHNALEAGVPFDSIWPILKNALSQNNFPEAKLDDIFLLILNHSETIGLEKVIKAFMACLKYPSNSQLRHEANIALQALAIKQGRTLPDPLTRQAPTDKSTIAEITAFAVSWRTFWKEPDQNNETDTPESETPATENAKNPPPEGEKPQGEQQSSEDQPD